jgi:hypothetical protein
MWPAERTNEMPMVAFTCLACRTSGAGPWDDFSETDQRRALILGVPGTYRAAGVM